MLLRDLEAKQGFLGALMLDNRALERISEFLHAYHFHIPVYQWLYEAILKLVERGPRWPVPSP